MFKINFPIFEIGQEKEGVCSKEKATSLTQALIMASTCVEKGDGCCSCHRDCRDTRQEQHPNMDEKNIHAVQKF